MQPEQEEWLRHNAEEPLDPDQPICDPHHHLWDHPRDRYLLRELGADTGAGHRTLWNAFQCIAADYSPAERDLLFQGTAMRTYRL